MAQFISVKTLYDFPFDITKTMCYKIKILMVKNIVITVLVIAVIAEGYFLYKSHTAMKQQQMAMTPSTQQKNMPPAGPNALRRGGGAPIMLGKGDNLKTSPLMKYAYQIAPGSLSADAQKALVGWKIATAKAADGSIVVTLTPSDSDDQNQQYTVKTGQILYFIEQTPADDKADQDKDLNYRDDYGIITDESGIIQ